MEKKKILESVKTKPKERPLASAIFLKERGNNSSAALFELYDKFVIFYTVGFFIIQNTEANEPHKKIVFDFDLIFEMVRGVTED